MFFFILYYFKRKLIFFYNDRIIFFFFFLNLLFKKKVSKDEENQSRRVLKPLNENEIKNSPTPISQHTDIESLQTLEEIDLEISRLQHGKLLLT